jgi:hypothetical protein
VRGMSGLPVRVMGGKGRLPTRVGDGMGSSPAHVGGGMGSLPALGSGGTQAVTDTQASGGKRPVDARLPRRWPTPRRRSWRLRRRFRLRLLCYGRSPDRATRCGVRRPAPTALFEQTPGFLLLLVGQFDAGTAPPAVGHHQPQPDRHRCPAVGTCARQHISVEPDRPAGERASTVPALVGNRARADVRAGIAVCCGHSGQVGCALLREGVGPWMPPWEAGSGYERHRAISSLLPHSVLCLDPAYHLTM